MSVTLDTLREQFSMESALASIAVAAFSIYVFYNLHLHPLAGIPGPLFCRAGLYSYSVLRAVKRDAAYHWEYLHARYGTYVRIGPNEVITVDETTWKEVYGMGTKWTKGTAYTFFGIGATPSLIAETDEHKHAILRRMVAPAYTTNALHELEPYVDEVIQLLDEKMRVIADKGEPWDACTWLQWFAMDVVGQLALGQPFGLLKSENDDKQLMHALDQNIYQSGIQGVLPYRLGRLWRSVIFNLAPIIGSGAGHLRLFTVASVKERIARMAQLESEGGSESERKDMLTHFLKAKHPQTGKPMTFPELCTTVGSLVGAGADTTAISIRAVIYYTLTTPGVYQKLMDELTEAHESGLLKFPIRYADGCKLDYLQATIKEALRYFPAGSLVLPRLSPQGGAHIGGHYFPQGTQLGMTSYPFHRRAYGPDGTEFKPERWLRDPNDDDETATTKRKRMEANFTSFGSGTHTCIGRNISLMEMTKVIPTIFWHYNMKITPRGPGSPHKYPYGRGLDGVRNGESWFVQGAWFSMQRDFFIDLTARNADDL